MASTSSSSRSTLANFVGLQGIATLNIIRNFLLVPIYLRHFGADLYGAWVAVLGMAALVQLADLGVPRMLIQRTAALHGVSDHLGLGRTAASGLVSLALVTLALLGLLFPLAGWMTSVFGLTGPRAVLITEASRLVLLDGVLMLFVYGEAGVLLGLQKPSQAMLSLILGQLVGIVATLVLLGQGISLPALPLGMLTGTGFALLLTTVALIRCVRVEVPVGAFRCHGATLRELLGSSILLTLSRLSQVVTQQAPAVLAATLLSPASAAVMDVSRKSSLLVADVVSRASMSFHPDMAHRSGIGGEDFQRTGRLMLRATYLLGALGVGGVLAFNRGFVMLWTGPHLYGGDLLTALLCAATLLRLTGTAAFFILLAGGAERVLSLASLFEAIVQITLLVALGHAFGLIGIALGTTVSAAAGLAVQTPLLLRLINAEFPGRRDLPRIVRRTAAGFVPIVLGLSVPPIIGERGWWQFGLFAVAYLFVCAVAITAIDPDIRPWAARRIMAALEAALAPLSVTQASTACGVRNVDHTIPVVEPLEVIKSNIRGGE